MTRDHPQSQDIFWRESESGLSSCQRDLASSASESANVMEPEQFERFLIENTHAQQTTRSAFGVVAYISETPNSATVFGKVLTQTGWVVDIVSRDHQMLHFVRSDDLGLGGERA